ncbi:hypothetical protein [Actinoplanes sp. NPDC049265]|uniref:hypothetical protein n=1 Tax=Actinoplanes sp. NPDC049265 TaxID=3363902 RepID=UPI00371928D6
MTDAAPRDQNTADAGRIRAAVERIRVHRDVTAPFPDALVAEAGRRRAAAGD